MGSPPALVRRRSKVRCDAEGSKNSRQLRGPLVRGPLDGLAGGPGRAFDTSLKFGYDLNDRWQVTLGYRTLEGGADVDSVYNFAWLHYGAASVVLRL